MTTMFERPDLKEASTGQLVRRLSEQLGELLRGEMELAKVELRDKGKRVGAGAGLAGAAGVLALFGLAAFITAAIAALALIGRSQIKRGTPPLPEQAISGIKQDVEAVKAGVRR